MKDTNKDTLEQVKKIFTDYLEQRAKLAERWADHVTGGAGQVVKLAGTNG